MIRVGIPAEMTCDFANCTNVGEAQLYLLLTGGFGFKPKSEGWQVMVARHIPGNPIGALCPKHIEELGPGPTGLRSEIISGR